MPADAQRFGGIENIINVTDASCSTAVAVGSLGEVVGIPRNDNSHVSVGEPVRTSMWRGISAFHVEFIVASYWVHWIAPFSPPMKTPRMKSSSATFFQMLIVLMGLGVLGLLLWEPHLEGRNAHATTFEIYFNDPFLAYVYVGSIPVFLALYQAFELIGRARRIGGFSRETLNALQIIKWCAVAVVCFVAGAMVFIIVFGDGEDRPAGVFMCLLVAFGASVAAAAAAMFARSLRGALKRAEGHET